MDNELVLKFIEAGKLQTALVIIILACIVIILCETIIDFIMSLFLKGWHSPNGFKCKKKANNDETK